MATVKISDLPAKTVLSESDYFITDDSATTSKALVSGLFKMNHSITINIAAGAYTYVTPTMTGYTLATQAVNSQMVYVQQRYTASCDKSSASTDSSLLSMTFSNYTGMGVLNCPMHPSVTYNETTTTLNCTLQHFLASSVLSTHLLTSDENYPGLSLVNTDNRVKVLAGASFSLSNLWVSGLLILTDR